MNIGKIGAEGEKRVANFLRKNGIVILKRNFQSKYGEIDIIGENKDFLIFVEVKTRKFGSMITGAEAVDDFKQRRIVLTAEDYIAKTQSEKQPRFDIAEVTFSTDEKGKVTYKLNYIPNAW